MKSVAFSESSKEDEKIEFEDFLESYKKFFKFVTFTFVWPSEAENSKEKVKRLIKDVFFWFSVANVCLMVSLVAVSAFRQSTGLSALTFAVPLVTSVTNMTVKCLTVYCFKTDISQLLNKIECNFPMKKVYRKHRVAEYLKNYKRFVRLYTFLFIMPCLSVIAIPLIKLFSTGQRSFPLDLWMPLSIHRTDVYAIAYLWCIWTCTNSVIVLIAIDSLMFVLITLISMEFDILKIDFLALKHTNRSAVERQTFELVQHHSELIECSGRLERIFSASFLYNFVQSSFVICLTAFQYMTSSEASQLLFNGSYCAAILNQVWLLCYFGQKIIDSSEGIAEGAYGCDWEWNENLPLQRALMVVIERAQTPVKLTAMNFTDVSLKSFKSVTVNFVVIAADSRRALLADFNDVLFLLYNAARS